MGSKVLLADDSVTIQKVVGIIFANEDYELKIVGNGDAALQAARETMPDVMLVDALMPGKNGYEVCQEIRRDPALQHISLLLMTGAFDAVDEEKKRQSGADDFITKPFESQSLLDVTARLIALSSERARMPAPQAAAVPPAAPQPVVAPATAAAAAVMPQTPPIDDIWGGEFAASFGQEAVPATPEPFDLTPAPEAAPVPAPVAAKADEDLWGVFDMDAADIAPAAAPVVQPPQVIAANDDFFSLDVEEPAAVAPAPAMGEFVLDEVAEPEAAPVAPQPAVAGFDAFAEFDLEQTGSAPAPAAVAPPVRPPAEDDFSTISFDEPEPVAPVVAAPSPAPVLPAAEVAPVAPLMPEPAAPTPTVSAAVSLDEDQLKALLANVSREVIERIVWEVVPDLAESIIREEIRKLKEGMSS